VRQVGYLQELNRDARSTKHNLCTAFHWFRRTPKILCINEAPGLFSGSHYGAKWQCSTPSLPNAECFNSSSLLLLLSFISHSNNLLCVIGPKVSSPQQSNFAVGPCYRILMNDSSMWLVDQHSR